MKLNDRLIYTLIILLLFLTRAAAQNLPKDFIDPPHEFSLMPFWFWNDTLKDKEIVRQIADFEAHGVYGFVIHPRIGLPDNVKWLSPEMIHSMNIAISEASKRGMYVVLYDEGSQRLQEESPPAGDILNPDAVTSFMELVYDRYAKEFGKFFGNTVIGIFTDEPSPLGRGGARGVVPGNASLIPQIKRILGYDITPFLADLWYNDNSDSKKHRDDYNRAINICLEENYYKRLGNWCFLHNIALMGHPAGSMDIGAERYFQIPGQDLVWRYVEPGPKALEGQHSTMAKCASSAMLHLGYRRNANELYGAYGHNLTFDEMSWLANWCFVRGQNFLIPHAFYYSIRGPRFEERPPDVGPNATWWNEFKPFADACRRLSWLNTDSRQICNIAILCDPTWLPDKSARVCYQNQRDFNYLELRHLKEDAKIDGKGVRIAGMIYSAVILDSLSFVPDNIWPLLKTLALKKHLIINARSKFASQFKGALVYSTPDDLLNAINKLSSPDLSLSEPSGNIRYRHVVKNWDHYYMLFNEEATDVSTGLRLQATGDRQWINPSTAEISASSENEIVNFKPHEMKILRVSKTR